VWPHDVESFQGSTFCLLWCSSRYSTAVEHRSLLNRSGICDGIICCIYINLNSISQKIWKWTYIYITDLVCYTNFHWSFNHECQHIFGKQTGYIFQSPKTITTWTTTNYASRCGPGHDVESFQASTFCLFWCSSRYGIAVEHMSLLNRSGICVGIICCNICFVHTAVLSLKTAFN
jgi:hypothetical protein